MALKGSLQSGQNTNIREKLDLAKTVNTIKIVCKNWQQSAKNERKNSKLLRQAQLAKADDMQLTFREIKEKEEGKSKQSTIRGQ